MDEIDTNEDTSSKSDDTTPNDKQFKSQANMLISLDGLSPSVDHSKFYSRIYNAAKAHGGQNPFGNNSVPPTSNAHSPDLGKAHLRIL